MNQQPFISPGSPPILPSSPTYPTSPLRPTSPPVFSSSPNVFATSPPTSPLRPTSPPHGQDINRGIKAKTTMRGMIKEKFKKKCLKRMKESRNALLEAKREAVPEMLKNIITNEFQKMSPNSNSTDKNQQKDPWQRQALFKQKMNQIAPPLSGLNGPANGSTFNEFEDEFYERLIEEDYCEIMECLQQSLKEEEERAKREYEENLKVEQKALEEYIEGQETECRVLCPVCKKNLLLQNKGVFFCVCGMRLNTSVDCISMNQLHQQILSSINLHQSSGCPEEPSFMIQSKGDVSLLCMICSNCQCFHIVV